jgi:hypothetical protein
VRGVVENALLWPAIRTAGQYNSKTFRVLEAAQAKDRVGMRVHRGVASNRRVIDAGTDLVAMVLWRGKQARRM